MGEVYRARDERLAREVAVKILPAELSHDPSRLRRFEKEARAASALNHPNIVTIYEIGSEGGTSYIAMELVAGRTLRELLLGGPMPLKKLLQISTPLAEGLSAAHEAGIVHRDLKPENVMVAKDGLVKILDFGLAKLTTAVGSGEESLPTLTRTEPGGLLGTVSYMSPEQAAGQPADFRSDQFSLGSILWELATGEKAFQRATAVDTLAAILHEEPAPAATIRPDLPVPFSWIVERCLAKEPSRRYVATRDLARDLEALRDRPIDRRTVAPPGGRQRKAIWLAAAALAVAGALFAGKTLWKTGPSSPPVFRRLTFGRGIAGTARFTADGQSVVYSAKWGGDPTRIFLTRPDGVGSIALPFPDGAWLFSISRGGDLALSLEDPGRLPSAHPIRTLAIAPLAGGAPRLLAEGVLAADWSADGKALAVSRDDHLEYPLGKVLYAESVDVPRVSPRGDRIAFGWSGGDVVRDLAEPVVSVVDLAGKRTDLARGQRNMNIVWTPDGEEIWFTTGSGWGNADTIRAVTLSGRTRVVARVPGFNLLADMSRDGRLLLVHGTVRGEVWCRPAGEPVERDLGWLSSPRAVGMSADGRTILLNEFAEGGGFGSAYLRKTDGSPAARVLDGAADALSPDGTWVACKRVDRILLVPAGAGEQKTMKDDRFEEYLDPVVFFPDGKRILFGAREKGKDGRFYVADLSGGTARAVTAEGTLGRSAISPDGRRLAVCSSDGCRLVPVDGGEPSNLIGLRSGEVVACWSEDSRSVYVMDVDRIPFAVFRVEIATGRREAWRTIGPADQSGVYDASLLILSNGSYALTVGRYLSDLYLVEGLR